jgi:hypothetical protein
MAANNPDFPSYQKFTPPAYEEPPRQHGCFFYGCIIASILSLLLLIAVGVMFFLFYRWAGRMVEEYTATAPRELPKVEMPAEQRKTVKERWDAFHAAVKEGKPSEPLVLNSDDMNVLIDEDEELKGKVYVSIDQDKLKGQISIPLEKLPILGLTRGRYLNGEAELKASIVNDVLFVTLDSIEVNGKMVPEEFMAQLRGQNMAKDLYKDAKRAEELRNLESIEIKDGKLTIKARDRTKKSESDKAGPLPRIETKDGKVIVHPPEEKPAPKIEVPPPAKKVPDDVTAPSGPPPATTTESAKKPSD